VFVAKTVQSRENLPITALKPWVKCGATFFGNRHINESSVRIDGRVPAAVGCIDADADEEGFHFLSSTFEIPVVFQEVA
jgi:hypothetical protein